MFQITASDIGDLHVITVPMGRSQGPPRPSGVIQGKPPDYCLVTEKPPSYEEAMSMLPPYTPHQPSSSFSHSREYLGMQLPDTPGSEETDEESNRMNSRLSPRRPNDFVMDCNDGPNSPSRVSISPNGPSVWSTVIPSNDVATSSYSESEGIPTSPPPVYSSNPSIFSVHSRLGEEEVNNFRHEMLPDIEEGSSSSNKDEVTSPKQKKKSSLSLNIKENNESSKDNNENSSNQNNDDKNQSLPK